MSKELELWEFVAERLGRGEQVTLLVVGESSGSSPGRAGYKMAVAPDGGLCGSIGGGVMEVSLVDRARGTNSAFEVIDQVHRKGSENSSGMICSGKQTVILRQLTTDDLGVVEAVIDAAVSGREGSLTITETIFTVGPPEAGAQNNPFHFEREEDKFLFREVLGGRKDLYIIGGGHCALALSELMSKLGFRISIFDDRPALNTIEKNKFADEITIIDEYEKIAEHIPSEKGAYVVVMTLGYATDAIVVRQLMHHDLKYFGVLGSKAKMTTLLKMFRDEGFDNGRLSRIRTPIGIPINSRTPEEIAVSIAAEIIQTKNK